MFNIGDKVICVNAKKRWHRLGSLVENMVYTVKGFNPYDGGLILEEIKSPNSGCNAYAAHRFRVLGEEFACNLYAQYKNYAVAA